MSVSLWNWSKECDYRPCPGDCDHCSYMEEDDDFMEDWEEEPYTDMQELDWECYKEVHNWEEK